MGWLTFDDHPDADKHEGFVVGLERVDGWAFREFRYSLNEPPSGTEVRYIQIGCECGWRSPVLLAPLGTKWVPACVVLPYESDEDAAARIWQTEHRDRLPAPGSASLHSFRSAEAVSG